jgi:hypothetical protein
VRIRETGKRYKKKSSLNHPSEPPEEKPLDSKNTLAYILR